ncbi:ABC-type nitrate/sulfonate/bicarbonate transport system, substrate-binding protein [Clostridium acidisoli DSM 12555]|uniref:ABC-type nitrate/sulfonate/bicarbonate transport system, substrate-binding protein n=1 Tax=Clostridium acidisoli DSM 12555 TaxID=1121291 RepID=A0A1W1XML7_9CLOT|nr:ABC transporter substrate-binding protein [Clostridium acidisoli]SMC25166.1 ABC-type nitrate/sulfonate/bicarbonate transport system, substrate-binding protein [Clostridium acidisoli DSM 12555]
MIKLKVMKKILPIGIAIMISLSFIGCSSKSDNYVKTSDGKKLFVVRMPTQTGFNEFDIADELGYFKEEGIQLKYTGLLNADTSEVQSVLTGNNDVFTNHPSTVVRAILAGAKIHIVAPGMVDNQKFVHMEYIVKDGGPVSTVEDFKKVAATRKIKWAVSSTDSCPDIIALEWAKQNKISKDKINFVIMPDEQQEQAIKQGAVDIGCLHPPYGKKAKNDCGTKDLFTSYDVVKGPAGGSSIRGFSDKFIKAHPEVVKGFTKAIVKAHHWINTHQQQAIAIEAKRLKMKPENMSIFWYDETNYIQKAYIQTWINMMVDDGSLKKDQVKATDIYTNANNPYHTAQ